MRMTYKVEAKSKPLRKFSQREPYLDFLSNAIVVAFHTR